MKTSVKLGRSVPIVTKQPQSSGSTVVVQPIEGVMQIKKVDVITEKIIFDMIL